MNRLRSHRPSPAMVLALLALFVAMGGVGYAALKLPKNSVGSRQLRANAVTSSKVKDASLRGPDFGGGQVPPGPAGKQGERGPNGVRGLGGDDGPRGPGPPSFDGAFARDGAFHNVATINGVSVSVRCDPAADPGDHIELFVGATGPDPGFHGWGTRWTGSALQRVGAGSGYMSVDGVTVAELNVVAQATASGGKYTAFYVNGIAMPGTCNYHAVIFPPAGQ
jgi:hypothetical protein